MNAGHGSASRIARLQLLAEPPSLDAGEITDNGYINQRRVLARRPELVRLLYTDPPPGPVITAPPS
jgi:feruloyl-CoA synthase